MLYKHFGSKQELFDLSILEPLDRAIAGLVERNSEPPETFDSTGDQVRAMTITFVRDLLVAMDEIGPLLIAALHSGNRSPLEAYRDLIEPYFETMSEVVETNLQSWSHQPFDPQLTSRMGFGAAFFITLSAQAKGEALDHDDVAEQIVSIFVDALHTPDAPPA
ncbi:hypothetical protein FM105_05405 [Brevibacterium yomogidense]|uniref:Transcriptional regulator, TetR family n=1 Tax=Brevibacterium yomogidense TaxID=946573 RepID=A0A1X6X9U9_9MICO|nr:hypothetical protein FM105_05405 [Brevibacterium yomogidense]